MNLTPLMLVRALALVPLLALIGLIWVAWRRGWMRSDWTPLVGGAQPARAGCRAETAMLAGLSIVVLTMITFRPYDGSLVIARGQAGYETLGWTLAGGAAAVCLLAALPALIGRTLVAVLLCTAVLLSYGFIVNYRSSKPGPFGTQASPQQPATYTFDAELEDGTPIPAELWINGVHLGTMPATLPIERLEAIPIWESPPAEMDPPEAWLEEPQYSRDSIHVWKKKTAWSKAMVHLAWAKGVAQGGSTAGDRRDYFARIRYAGKWGWSSGGGGGSQGWTMTVQFPDENSLPAERLLDQARANDYRVTTDWLAAMDSLKPTLWSTLEKRADREPQFAAVMDQWAVWKYDLDTIRTPEAAWAAFDRIGREAEESGRYDSNSMAGRAVELLVPRLDPLRLVTLAEQMIGQTMRLSYHYQTRPDGRIGFGYSRGGASRMSGTVYSRSTGNSRDVDMRLYPVAHAVWALDRRLDSIDDRSPNLVEQHIPRALLTYHFRNEEVLLIANALGGCPGLDQYLIRQDWQISGSELNTSNGWPHRMTRYGSEPINKWLYLLAHLDSPAGAAFRLQHRREIMSMLDDCLADAVFHSDALPAFLFADLNQGSKSLAAEYWPKFVTLGLRQYEQLQLQFQYLARMEPISTTEMYVQAWRSHGRRDVDASEALKHLSKLPAARVLEIVAALRAEVEQSPPPNGPEYVRSQLDSCILRSTRSPQAEQIMKDLAGERGAKMREALPQWLEHRAPDHPVIGMLADATDPALRILVMGALRAHPSPENRKLLTRLESDADPQVRSAAKDVRDALNRLSAARPADLIRTESPPTTVAATR